MKGKVFLIQWDTEAAAKRAEELRRAGWETDVESEDRARAYAIIRTSPPDVVVMDLSRKPAYALEVAAALRRVRAMRTLPLVFVGADAPTREKVRPRFDNAAFADDDLTDVLDRLREALPPAAAAGGSTR